MAATPIPENQVAFTPDEIVAATGACVLQAPTRAVAGVSVDSRQVAPGNLFVALRGQRHDAHDHVSEVVARGAHALLVDREVLASGTVPTGVGVFRVDDTLSALGALAAFHRRRFDVPVVAITGSVGKTSTKELVAAALVGLGRRTAFTRGNLNNRIGVPMTLFTLGPEHDAAVIEIGMNVPGEVADLTAIAAPTVGVVTSVAHVHTEGVGGLEGVAREKGSLLTSLGPDAVAVWNVDAPLLAEHAARATVARSLGYGLDEHADVRLVRWELDGMGTRASYRLPHRDLALEVRLGMLGEAAAVNAAGALAVLEAIAPDRLEEALEAIGAVPPPPHRMVPETLSSGALLVDDGYNASPRSTVAALETCSVLASSRGGKLIAVLGDMYELGRDAEKLHADVGREAVRAGAAVLIACGELMTHAGRAAVQASMESGRGGRVKVVLLRNPEDAAACVRERWAPSDVVLVKGSRGMRMERVVEALRRDAPAASGEDHLDDHLDDLAADEEVGP
jgi:UDP-N-acetylmuramoyl-tripeptide--D-alanyl-D-alanine ligase